MAAVVDRCCAPEVGHILGTGQMDPEKETEPPPGSTMRVPSHMAEEAGGIQQGASVKEQQGMGLVEHWPEGFDLWDCGVSPWGWKAVSFQGAFCWFGWAVLEVEKAVCPQVPHHEASFEDPGLGAFWWTEGQARPA